MKKAFSTLLFLFISLNFFAQASFTSMGIAVQGIARDNQNNKYSAKDITLEFQFFYYSNDNSTGKVNVGTPKFKGVKTDDFGVFSTIIDDYGLTNSDFSNNKLWISIKVQGDSNPLQETQLMHVPYAISANNGVPTGTIMAFIGTKDDVPDGWLLCDGVTVVPQNSPLYKLLKATYTKDDGIYKTPELQGAFLKGVGQTAFMTQVEPIPLGRYQDMQTKIPEHEHEVGSLIAESAGSEHRHMMRFNNQMIFEKGSDQQGYRGTGGQGFFTNNGGSDGAHKHPIYGRPGPVYNYNELFKDKETRPNSFGVNYIIKL